MEEKKIEKNIKDENINTKKQNEKEKGKIEDEKVQSPGQSFFNLNEKEQFNKKIIELKEEINNKEKEINNKEIIIKQLKNEKDTLNEENIVLKNENDRINEENKLLKNENDRINEENILLKNENDRINEENILLKKENDTMFGPTGKCCMFYFFCFFIFFSLFLQIGSIGYSNINVFGHIGGLISGYFIGCILIVPQNNDDCMCFEYKNWKIFSWVILSIFTISGVVFLYVF